MKTVSIILFVCLIFVSCDSRKVNIDERSFSSNSSFVTENSNIEIRDVNHDGLVDIIIVGLDQNGNYVPAYDYLYNPDSDSSFSSELGGPNLKYEKLSYNDFLTYGVKIFDSQGFPETYLVVGNSLVSLSDWIEDKNSPMRLYLHNADGTFSKTKLNRDGKLVPENESDSSTWFHRNWKYLFPEN